MTHAGNDAPHDASTSTDNRRGRRAPGGRPAVTTESAVQEMTIFGMPVASVASNGLLVPEPR